MLLGVGHRLGGQTLFYAPATAFFVPKLLFPLSPMSLFFSMAAAPQQQQQQQELDDAEATAAEKDGDDEKDNDKEEEEDAADAASKADRWTSASRSSHEASDPRQMPA